MIKSFFKAAARESLLPRALGKGIARAAFFCALALITGCAAGQRNMKLDVPIPARVDISPTNLFQDKEVQKKIMDKIIAAVRKNDKPYIILPYDKIEALQKKYPNDLMREFAESVIFNNRKRASKIQKDPRFSAPSHDEVREILTSARDVTGHKIEETNISYGEFVACYPFISGACVIKTYGGVRVIALNYQSEEGAQSGLNIFEDSKETQKLWEMGTGYKGLWKKLSPQQRQGISLFSSVHEFGHYMDKNIYQGHPHWQEESYADLTAAEFLYEGAGDLQATRFMYNMRCLSAVLSIDEDHATLGVLAPFLKKHDPTFKEHFDMSSEDTVKAEIEVQFQLLRLKDNLIKNMEKEEGQPLVRISDERFTELMGRYREACLKEIAKPGFRARLSGRAKTICDLAIKADKEMKKIMAQPDYEDVPKPTSPYLAGVHAKLFQNPQLTN